MLDKGLHMCDTVYAKICTAAFAPVWAVFYLSQKIIMPESPRYREGGGASVQALARLGLVFLAGRQGPLRMYGGET